METDERKGEEGRGERKVIFNFLVKMCKSRLNLIWAQEKENVKG